MMGRKYIFHFFELKLNVCLFVREKETSYRNQRVLKKRNLKRPTSLKKFIYMT